MKRNVIYGGQPLEDFVPVAIDQTVAELKQGQDCRLCLMQQNQIKPFVLCAWAPLVRRFIFPLPITEMRRSLITYLPDWTRDWLEIIVPSFQILVILLVAWIVQYALRRLVERLARRYQLPLELTTPLKTFLRWTIMIAALMLVLERMGVSATVLWTAFTGFATVGAVAFFAAWSVLSNLFCAFLIFSVRPFRVGDTIELLDTAEKPGAIGRVVDINLLYITLQDSQPPASGALLQIPNALIFQRVVRRWPQGTPPPPMALIVPVPSRSAVSVQTPIEPRL